MRVWIMAAGLLALSACAGQPSRAPIDPVVALEPYAAALGDLPKAPPGPPLPDARTELATIAFGSCQTAEREIPILERIAAERPQLMVYLGDNVYGDAHAGDMSLPELRSQYARLSQKPEFRHLRQAVPMMATWDDHDMAWNDGGRDFTGRIVAQRMFEAFWGMQGAFKQQDGLWHSRVFGPEGRRVQIIMLDTRSGRSSLTRLPQTTPTGRYAPSQNPEQRMLSDAQWSWLETQLRQPADLRFVVSSIQILADAHGWEAWRTLPREQTRLYDVIRRAHAKGVVFISGDRHLAALYRADGLLGQRTYELTSSSLNLSHRDISDEMSSHQIGQAYAPINYGMARIDWPRRKLALQIISADGEAVREQVIDFAELGL